MHPLVTKTRSALTRATTVLSRMGVRMGTGHAGVLVALLLLGGLTHGVNMFNYPYYEGDEGTYTSQAWSLVREGSLSPYTYWYDHPPMGWIVIASWFELLGGDVFAFGTSTDTARVLMLLIHLGILTALYWLSYRVSGSRLAAFATCALYALSPLGIYFRRRVLLDNLMTFWLLLAYLPLLVSRPKLRHFALSGVLYGLGFLTKVTAAMWGPALLYMVAAYTYTANRAFRITAWLFFSISSVSLYLMYALMKNEFFPSGWFDTTEHVSLIGALGFQMGRKSAYPFYHPSSDFMGVLMDWMNKDALTVWFIVLATLGGVLLWRIKPLTRGFTIALFLYTLFLIRGGIVLNFYVQPLLATATVLGGALLSVVAEYVAQVLSKLMSLTSTKELLARIHVSEYRLLSIRTHTYHTVRILVLVLCILSTLWYYLGHLSTHYLSLDEVSPQRDSIAWIKANLPEEAAIIIDNTMLVELKDERYINTKTFDNADWFYKVSNDPSIRIDKFNNNWKSFEYVALTHEMLKQIQRFEETNIVRQAFENSLPIHKWIRNSSSFIDEQKLITTNGDWSMVYEVNGNTKAQLVDSWNSYRTTHIHSYGQVIDPQNGLTTSEGQSYAMLRAAWMNDRATFDGVWAWTRHHLQHRIGDTLISWKWEDDTMLDATNASDADVDIALALLFASKVWQDDTYLEAARELIDDIWAQNVVDIDGTLYLLAMNQKSAAVHQGYLFNPSYLSPAHFRIFAEVDQAHDWTRLADDSYKTLERTQTLTASGLPANWYVLNKESGELMNATVHMGENATLYGYDAFRTTWRIGLDAQWYQDSRAIAYLAAMHDTLQPYTVSTGRVPSEIHTLTSDAVSTHMTRAPQVGYLVTFTHGGDRTDAARFYEQEFEQAYDESTHMWGDPENYYDQNWVWFGIGLFNNDLPNLWARL